MDSCLSKRSSKIEVTGTNTRVQISFYQVFSHQRRRTPNWSTVNISRCKQIVPEPNKKNNSLINKWTQINSIITSVNLFEPSNKANINFLLGYLDTLGVLRDSSQLQFIQDQLQLLITPPNGHRSTKHSFILAAELFCISRSAYRMLQYLVAVCLLNEKLIRNLFLRCTDDHNLGRFFEELKPEQQLFNILFDEVKLVGELRYCGGYTLDYSTKILSKQIPLQQPL